MTQIRFHVARSLVAVPTLSGLAAACSSADPEPEQSEMDLSEAELWETSAPLERGDAETRAEADVTLADIHRHLLPGTSVPAALVQADARAAARASAPDYEAQPPDDAFASDSEFAKPGASAVAWDWNADAMRRDLAAAAAQAQSRKRLFVGLRRDLAVAASNVTE
ncbi:hypothetical protein [Sorangium sp. So ce542]